MYELEKFFNESLKLDNFEGLALLSSYVQKHNIPIDSWNLSKFRSALDFYLNHSFDLSKLLTFTKFFSKYLQDKVAAKAPLFAQA